VDHPHLQAARLRLRRSEWAWSALCFALAALALVISFRPGGHPISAIAGAPWLATALLLAFSAQPALLALLAAQLAFSLALLLPGATAIFGPDPVATIFGATGVEAVFTGVIRVVLAVTAWSQFSFYRMLYGTAAASGLERGLPPIPEVVPNRSDAFARAALSLGAIAVVGVTASFAFSRSGLGAPALAAGHSLAIYAIGLGLGAAFSPTTRRGSALAGTALGGLAFLGAVAASRFLVA
jgi:hypothetical protein